ncbi:pentapeptide repeat-containing protein, partial [Rothia nasisuis]
ADLAGANLGGAHLERANLAAANLEEADLEGAHLERAYLWDVHLEGANLMDARLDKASFFDEFEENPQNPEVRGRIIDQLKASAILPAEDELLKAEGFDQTLVDEIIQAHKEEQAGKEE